MNWFKGFLQKLPGWFTKNKMQPPEKKVYEFQSAIPTWIEPDKVRPTKAYADQRQRAPHNRRHKPSKAMRHLYHLS